MKTSLNGHKFLLEEEGVVLHPYLDSKGVPTIGAGNTYYEDGRKVKMSDPPISRKRAMELKANVLPTFEAAVNKVIAGVTINQNQFDALVSLCYNIGVGAFLGSTVARLVKKDPNNPALEAAFLAWRKAGNDLTRLLSRRKREYKLYTTPTAGVVAKFTTTDLHLRENPTASSKSITILPKGTELNVLNEDNGWAQVFICNNRMVGYVSTAYIK